MASSECPTPQRFVTRQFNFLALPYEIRLAIYRWVQLDHEVHFPQLDAAYPNPTWTPYSSNVITMKDLPNSRKPSQEYTPSRRQAVELKKTRRPPWQYRPICRIPISLLTTNKQIYLESRSITFHENEFAFVTWFSSGLPTAVAFTKWLKQWQRSALRYVRLEVSMVELRDGGTEKWKEFCRLLSHGLCSLRLRLQRTSSPRVIKPPTETHPEDSGPSAEMDDLWRHYPPQEFMSTFAGLAALRILEVELSDPKWGLVAKGAWCEALNNIINRDTTKQGRLCLLAVESGDQHVHL